MVWLELVLSGLVEVAWLVSLRESQGFTRPIPVVCWALTGPLSAWLLSRVLRSLPMTVAFSIWTGVTVVVSSGVEILVYGQVFNPWRGVFAALVIAGIVGVRASSPQAPGIVAPSEPESPS